MGKLPETHFRGNKGGAWLDFVTSLEQLLIVHMSTLLERMRHANLMLQEAGTLGVGARGEGKGELRKSAPRAKKSFLPLLQPHGQG